MNENTFTPTIGTSPGEGQPFVLAAVGDGAGGEPSAEAVTQIIASWNPNMVLYLGDVYEDGTFTEFYNWYAPDRYFGRFRTITNPTVGNHEYDHKMASGYFDYWDNVPNYYSVDAGGWHIVSLNSTNQFGQRTPGSPQYQWLQQDLASSSADCTIVFFHHPIFNVGPEGASPTLGAIWALLAEYDVDIVLTAHDHSYQRWKPLNGEGQVDPNGVTQFVVGGGGHGIQQFILSDDRLAVGIDENGSFGALRLVLNEEGAAFQFITVQGVERDSGSIACSGAEDLTPPTTPENLTATAVSGTQVLLEWDLALDNVGVVAYDIFRDGVLVATTALPGHYTDADVAPGTSYTYQVQARDAAGNTSDLSNEATVTTPALFFDSFESGDLSQWTNGGWSAGEGLQVVQGDAASGQFSAHAVVPPSPAYALRHLGASPPDLYCRVRFKINSQSTNVYLVRLRTGNGSTGSMLAGIYVAPNGLLYLRNDVTLTNTPLTTTAIGGGWHEIQLRTLITGADPAEADDTVQVWLDGNLLTTMTTQLGVVPAGRIQLGDNTASGREYDVLFDDVAADVQFVGSSDLSDITPPSGPVLTIAGSGPNQDVDGATLYYNPAAGNSGTFSVTAEASDPESGIDHVSFQEVFGGDALNDTTSPYQQTYFWADDATAQGARTVTAVNGDGLTASNTFAVTADTEGPGPFAITAPTNGAAIRTGQMLSASPYDELSGVGQVEFRFCPGTVCAWEDGIPIAVDASAPFQVAWSSQPADGPYTIVARATDNVGNATDSPSIWVVIDNAAPTVTLDSPASGATVSGVVTLIAGAADTGSGIASVTFQVSPGGTGAWSDVAIVTSEPYEASWDTSAIPDGSVYDVRAVATDFGGSSATSETISLLVDDPSAFMFADGFETGDLSHWTSGSSLVVQQEVVLGGMYAARGTSTGVPTFARKALAAPQADVYYRIRFNVVSIAPNTVYLVRLRTASDEPILGVFISSIGRLGIRNDVIQSSTTSSQVVTTGDWHELQIRLVTGAGGQVEVWYDGERIGALSSLEDFGGAPVGRIQLGEHSSGRTYDIAFDDVAVDPACVGSCPSAPTPTPTAPATPTSDVTVEPTPTVTPDPPTSTPLPTPTPIGGVLFGDDFETGDLSRWTVPTGSALQVQELEVYAGAHAARGASTGAPAYIYKSLGAEQSEVYYRVRFKVMSQGQNTVYLLRVRTSDGVSILGVYLAANGRLSYRNDIAGRSNQTGPVVSQGVWHELQVRVWIDGADGQVEIWIDGVRIDPLSQTENVGEGGVGRIQLGENAAGRSFDIAFDDVAVDLTCIGACPSGVLPTPTATSTPTAVPSPTPTDTPEPPTNTPEPSPTATLTPTAVPSPTPTDIPVPPTNTPEPPPTATSTPEPPPPTATEIPEPPPTDTPDLPPTDAPPSD